MSVRINDFVEYKLDNKIIRGNVININSDKTFNINTLIDDKKIEIKNLKEENMSKIISNTVLIYLDNGNEYLMLLRNKRKNDMSEGKWLGLGGHIEMGETPDMAVVREVKEESNLDLINYLLRGIVYFYNDNYMETMHLYTSSSFKGDIKESDEGTLKWINKSHIMDLNIWEGDKSFLPLLMEDNPYFEMAVYYENSILKRIEKY